jgi:1,4-alpha-glucan branching enzyme
MVTRGQAVDYAFRRADEHRADFHRLAQLVDERDQPAARAEAARQAASDNPFPWLDARALVRR